jgi:thiol-disulfide isomerase/thioredoxin
MKIILVALTAAALGSSASADDSVSLKPMEKGAMRKIGFYMPQRLTLVAEKPATLKKVPDGLTAPRYGVLPLAGALGTAFHVVLDEAEGKPAMLLVDSNGNGDLTDDAPVEWSGKPQPGRSGKAYTMYSGTAAVQIGTSASPFSAGLGMYRFDPSDPGRAALKDVILYYRDYAATGEVSVSGRSMKAMLSDDAAAGDFRGKAIEEGNEGARSGVNLILDVNGNGKFDSRGESFDVRKPFNIAGTTYEIADMARDGLSFRVVKSTKTVDEVPTPPDHAVGKKIMPFEAKTMDGKTVKFPEDFKGKVVMLDFWATWCGPCMGEMPGLAAAYEKRHPKGFEILGVSLDQENADDKIKQVSGQNKMTWSQVYDGKFWKAAIADSYAINSIPAAFLVDGDTGEILAMGGSLRGDQLERTLDGALEKKAKQ